MKFLKLVLIGILALFLLFVGMRLISMAVRAMFVLLVLALIGFAAMALWKMFGSKGPKQVEDAEPGKKFQNPELTLEEYKRKLEAQLKNNTER